MPYSHNDLFPELYQEIKGQVQELPLNMHQFKKIYLGKDQLFVTRRNLIHYGGCGNNPLTCENRQYCDMSYHDHVVFTSQLSKHKKNIT